MVDVVTANPAVIPRTTQLAENDNSGVSMSGALMVIVILVAGILLFRRFLMPTTSSMLSAVRQIFSTRAGVAAGVVGVVVVGFLLLGGF